MNSRRAWAHEAYVPQGLDCGAESDAVDALIDQGRWPEGLRRQWRLAGSLA